MTLNSTLLQVDPTDVEIASRIEYECMPLGDLVYVDTLPESLKDHDWKRTFSSSSFGGTRSAVYLHEVL
jgi:hypothetical protein